MLSLLGGFVLEWFVFLVFRLVWVVLIHFVACLGLPLRVGIYVRLVFMIGCCFGWIVNVLVV